MSSSRLRPVLRRSSSFVKSSRLIVDATTAVFGSWEWSAIPQKTVELTLPDLSDTTRLQRKIRKRDPPRKDREQLLTAVLGLEDETEENLVTSVPAANESDLTVVNIPAGSSAVLHGVMNALQLPFSLEHLETLATAFAEDKHIRRYLAEHVGLKSVPEIPPLLSGQNFPRESTRPLNLITVSAFAECFRRKFAHFYMSQTGQVKYELLPHNGARGLKDKHAIGAILTDSDSARLRVLYVGGKPRVSKGLMLSQLVRDRLQAQWREIFKLRERQMIKFDDRPLPRDVVSDEPPIRVSFPVSFLRQLRKLCPSVDWSSPEPPERSEGNLRENRCYVIYEGTEVGDLLSSMLKALNWQASPVFMQQLFDAYLNDDETSGEGRLRSLAKFLSRFTDRAFGVVSFSAEKKGSCGKQIVYYGDQANAGRVGLLIHDEDQNRWGFFSAGSSTRVTRQWLENAFRERSLGECIENGNAFQEENRVVTSYHLESPQTPARGDAGCGSKLRRLLSSDDESTTSEASTQVLSDDDSTDSSASIPSTNTTPSIPPSTFDDSTTDETSTSDGDGSSAGKYARRRCR